MKRIIKIIGLVLVFFFLIVFFNRNSYYDDTNVLSDDAIERFETDLKEGKEIVPSRYLNKKNSYNNRMSVLFLKISKSIEVVVNGTVKSLLRYLDNWQKYKKIV